MRIKHIRNKLMLAGSIAVAPLIAWNILTAISIMHQNQTNAISSQQITAKRIAFACRHHLGNIVNLEQCISTFSSKLQADVQVFAPSISQSSECIRHIAFLNPDGLVLASDMRSLIGANLHNIPSVQEVMKGKGWAVSDQFYFEPMKQNIFTVTAGVYDERNRLRHMIVSFCHPESLQKALEYDMIEIPFAVILDRKCNPVLARGFTSPLHPDWHRIKLINKAMTGKSTAVFKLTMPNGSSMVAAAEPVPEVGWVAVTFTPIENIIAPVREQAINGGLVVLTILAATLALGLYLGNHITTPLLKIAEVARRYANGELNVRANINTGDEVQFLADTFNEMASTLEHRSRELNSALECAHRQAQKASTFSIVAQGLVVATSVHDRLEIIAHTLALLCNAKRAVVLLAKKDRLVGITGWGLMYPTEISKLSIPLPPVNREIAEAIETGKPLLVPDASASPYLDPSVVLEYNIKGYLLIPLIRRQHLVGVIFLDTPGEYPKFDPEAIEIARGVASLAAVAIENAEAFEKWFTIASALQRSLLPPPPDKIGLFKFACGYYPAIGIAEVGGDFYDFIPIDDNRIGLVIADVSGKGLEAAIHTAMGKYTLRAFISEQHSPSEATRRTNQAIIGSQSLWGFLTLFYGVLDVKSGYLTYTNAGHPPPILVRASGEILMLPSRDHQPPLGVYSGINYLEREIYVDSGDMLVCYTDGVIEARRNGKLLGIEGVIKVIKDHTGCTPAELVDALYHAVRDFCGGKLQDDVLLMVAKNEGI
jgi:GAF domain-containing protein